MSPAITQAVKSSVAWAGWRIARPAPSAPVILLYHGTPRKTVSGRVDEAAFAEQIRFLKQHFDLIVPDALHSRPERKRPRVLLTFDDGFRNNYEVARPILRAFHAPAVFFVTSRHSEPRKYLWFAYLRALEDWFPENAIRFRGLKLGMEPAERHSSMERLKHLLLGLRPHPEAMYSAIENELPALESFLSEDRIQDLCAGMSAEQVRRLAADPLFQVGCHTLDHPFLTWCEPQEMVRQIGENKRWIEGLTGIASDAIAYPSGDYNAAVVAQCERMGFRQGHAVIPATRPAGRFGYSRIGIYGTSLDVLGFVVRWGNTLRAMRVPLG